MALDAEAKRRCYLYTGTPQISATGSIAGGSPEITPAVWALEGAIANLAGPGETTVTGLLTKLDTLYTALFTVEERFQAEKVGSITLNRAEWSERTTQFEWFRMQLARTLGVQLDPLSDADNSGGGSQGPWREP